MSTNSYHRIMTGKKFRIFGKNILIISKARDVDKLQEDKKNIERICNLILIFSDDIIFDRLCYCVPIVCFEQEQQPTIIPFNNSTRLVFYFFPAPKNKNSTNKHSHDTFFFLLTKKKKTTENHSYVDIIFNTTCICT